MRSRLLFVIVCAILLGLMPFLSAPVLSAPVTAQTADRPVVGGTIAPIRGAAAPSAPAAPAATAAPSPAEPAAAMQAPAAAPKLDPAKGSVKPETAKKPEAPKNAPKNAANNATKKPAATKPTEKPADKPATPKKQPESASAAEPTAVRLSSAQLLPGYTKAWFSIPDMQSMKDSFNQTQFGLLAKDEAIKPFIDSLQGQFKDWANEKNVRLGVKIENLDQIYSGEICLAGIVPSIAGQDPERGSHGLVLLVDVQNTEKQATDVLADINRRLVKQGAVQDTIEINGATVTRSKTEKGKRLRASQTTLQTIYDGWLLASDNEKIFRDVIFRLATTKPDTLKPDALASQPAFKTVMNRSDLAPQQTHVKWFLDPFGYIRLAQALADDNKESREHRDDWAKILQSQGFDAIQGAGGQFGFLTGSHELMHRTFVYMPRKTLTKPEQKRVFGLFDFSNTTGKAVAPADWIPNDISAFFVGKWNLASALENVGFLYDAFLEDPGAFERVLQDFKNDPDMQLNIRKLVAQLDNEWSIISATKKPIEGNSERVAIAFKLKAEGDGKFVLDSIRRAIGRGSGTSIKLGGVDVIEVDTEKPLDDDEIPDDIFDDPLAGDDFGDEEEEEEAAFTLFDKKYFAVQHGHLIVANHKDYMKRILADKQKKNLSQMGDYQRVEQALNKMVDNKLISSRQFGRLDQALEANYELLRAGKMENSNTVLAKVVNRLLEQHASQEGEPSEMARLDAKQLPDDYQKAIAPYLGVMGWANEVEEDGWRISGCLLKREQ